MAKKSKKEISDFKTITSEKRPSIISEFWYFLKHNKKWWLLPIIIILLLMSLLLLLGGSGLAPFIYPLF